MKKLFGFKFNFAKMNFKFFESVMSSKIFLLSIIVFEN